MGIDLGFATNLGLDLIIPQFPFCEGCECVRVRVDNVSGLPPALEVLPGGDS